jgi:hypothetical protein
MVVGKANPRANLSGKVSRATTTAPDEYVCLDREGSESGQNRAPATQRVRWFRTFAMNVSQIYDGDAMEPVELKSIWNRPPTEAALWWCLSFL